MGLALTEHLVDKGYKVGMLDINAESGRDKAASFGDEKTLFIAADLTSYEDQAAAFRTVWSHWGRLDFGKCIHHVSLGHQMADWDDSVVAVNGGILDSCNMYKVEDKAGDSPPPKPNLKTIEVNTTGAIYTVYLAVNYFARNASKGGKITVTASAVALYPLDSMPVYSASKAAVSCSSQAPFRDNTQRRS